jgi:hypothetical protein
VTKLIISFLNFGKAPNNQEGYSSLYRSDFVSDATVHDS